MAWSDIVSAIQQQGQSSGLSSAEILIAQVIAYFETGGGASLYNAWDVNGPSVGIFQFHTGGPGNPGQLDGFAKWLGLPMFNSDGSPNQAVIQAAMNPVNDVQYALRPTGYLYNSLQAGVAKGLSGAALAIYVETFGQGAQVDSLVQTDLTNIYNSLSGTSTPNPSYPPVPPPATNQPSNAPGTTQLPAGTSCPINTPFGTVDPCQALSQAFAPLTTTFGTGLNDLVNVSNWLGQPILWERIGMVVIGGVILIVGVVFFGLSFLPKSAARAVPVVGGVAAAAVGT